MEPDLKLILDDDTAGLQVEIVVWHQVMINASPYFQSLLLPGNFAEGNTLAREGKVEISLPETNAQAMRVICDIFHLRHNDIPTSDITSTLLFEIAVLVDKFDCAKPVQPWLYKWMEQDHIRQELDMIQHSIGQSTAQELSKWICICRVMGHTDLLNRFRSALARFYTIDDITQKSNAYYDQLPSSFIDEVMDTHTRVMTSFHGIMIEFAELVERGDSCHFSSVSTVEGFPRDVWVNYVEQRVVAQHFHCSSVTLGNFLLAARAELGSTWRSLDSWTGSIESTYSRMQQVARHLTGPAQITQGALRSNKKVHGTHENCSLRERFNERVEDVMRMLDDHVGHTSVTALVEGG